MTTDRSRARARSLVLALSWSSVMTLDASAGEPATDMEDGPKGFGGHSDQERILESELHRFVRLNWEVVTSLARAQ